MKDFAGKVALVTGGSRGIGRAVCAELSRRGARVIIGFATNEEAAAEVGRSIRDAGGDGSVLQFDVASTAACAQAVGAIEASHGRLDILVNNAGITSDGLLARAKDADWERTIDTNLRGPFALMRAACRPMMKQRSGSIVNVASVIGEMGNAGQAIYAASKAGLLGLTKSIARELGSRNIRVNCVTPGFISTDMTSALGEATQSKLERQIALGRVGKAEEVAAAVAFLASDAASYITGAVLKVNGGFYM